MAERILVPENCPLRKDQYEAFGDFVVSHFDTTDSDTLQARIIREAAGRVDPSGSLDELVGMSTLDEDLSHALLVQQLSQAKAQAKVWVETAQKLEPERLLPAVGYVIMTVAHRNQARKANNELYAHHSERVAAMGHTALTIIRESYPEIADELIDSDDYGWLMHDVDEDQKEQLHTPQTSWYVHAHHEIRNRHATDAARTLTLMEFRRVPWLTYDESRTSYGVAGLKDAGWRRRKHPDVVDNSLQRKPARTPQEILDRAKTEASYDELALEIPKRAVESGSSPWEPLYHRIIAANRRGYVELPGGKRFELPSIEEQVRLFNHHVFGRYVSVEELTEQLTGQGHSDHRVSDYLVA